ncbi:MAG TPA: hypothetical protein VI793_02200 [Anaerolineales bacterium]|nr:hypothetical protein [Anaerolineales bacterium]
MFNDYLANAEAKQHIERRVQEAEAYRVHQRIGAADSGITRWAVALLALMGLAVAFGSLF